MSSVSPNEIFSIERRGDIVIFTASQQLERIDFRLHREVSDILLKPLEKLTNPQVVIDLTGVDYFGSMFLAMLWTCYRLVEEERGGNMALVGVSTRARELLRLTALSEVLPIYDTRRDAIEALLSE